MMRGLLRLMCLQSIILLMAPAVLAVDCVGCHEKSNASLVGHWKSSKHFEAGVGCIDCHQAEAGETDAFRAQRRHLSRRLSRPKIAVNVTRLRPNRTAPAVTPTAPSSSVRSIISWARLSRAPPPRTSGCRQCHGSEVKVLSDGKLDPATWPNTGIGRINPDGSRGVLFCLPYEALVFSRPRPAARKTAAAATWAPIIPISKSTTNPNTASNSEPRRTK